MSLWGEFNTTEFELRFVDVGGVRTRVLRAGSGPPVVFLHGVSGHIEMFGRAIPAHARHFGVHAIDLLGHGYTAKPDRPYVISDYLRHVLDYFDAAGLERAHVVGQSLGGWVAAALAIRHPERVERLTLVSPGGAHANPAVMASLKSSTSAAASDPDPSLTRKRLELVMFDPRSVTDEIVEIRHAILQQPEMQARLHHVLALQEPETRAQNLLSEDDLAQIRAPSLIFWGVPGDDQEEGGEVQIWPLAEGEFWQQAIPNSELVVLERCAHLPSWERPDEFNARNIPFLLGS